MYNLYLVCFKALHVRNIFYYHNYIIVVGSNLNMLADNEFQCLHMTNHTSLNMLSSPISNLFLCITITCMIAKRIVVHSILWHCSDLLLARHMKDNWMCNKISQYIYIYIYIYIYYEKCKMQLSNNTTSGFCTYQCEYVGVP